MRVNPTALCKFVICSWCRDRGVDRSVKAVESNSKDEKDHDVDINSKHDEFTDNPVDEKEIVSSSSPSCGELEDMDDTVQGQAMIQKQQGAEDSPIMSPKDSSWLDFMSKYLQKNPDVASKIMISDDAIDEDSDSSPPLPPDAFRTLIDAYKHEGEEVDMGPRRCSYTKKNTYESTEVTAILGEEIPRKKNANGSSYTPMPIELRGITLRQLRGINANVIARCEKEGWLDHKGEPLTPETVTLYDINKYVVLPFTKDTQASFVETLPSTSGSQPPRFFLSHWWGEPFMRTLACLEQFVRDFRYNFDDSDDARGGGMTIDTPIWICIFANNQWKLEDAISIDPKHSSFTKALTGTAENRVISILDAEGIVFTRIWCDFELHLTFTAQIRKGDVHKGLWAVYTAHKHTYFDEERSAVGIISGGEIRENAFYSARRESHFPTELILKSRNIKIQSAQASMDSDRVHILNSIAGKQILGADPPPTHPNYDKVNDAVRGAFATSVPALKAALATGEDAWNEMLVSMSKGVRSGTFELNFDSFIGSQSSSPRLTSPQARALVSHIPLTCNGLDISKAKGDDGEGAIEGMIDWLEKAKAIRSFRCAHCKVGDWYSRDENAGGVGRDAGIRLAVALEASHHAETIEVLAMVRTDLIVSGNVPEWTSALKKMISLEKLEIYGAYITEEEMSILENATHASDVTIKK